MFKIPGHQFVEKTSGDSNVSDGMPFITRARAHISVCAWRWCCELDEKIKNNEVSLSVSIAGLLQCSPPSNMEQSVSHMG